MLEVDVHIRKLASDHHLQITDDAVNVSLGCSAAPVGCFGGKLDRDRLAHVLLWFAVVAFDVIKMNEIMPHVYRENLFSVDFEENPMFTRVKQGSLFGNVGLSGVLLSVFRERCVSPEIDVVVGMEHPGAALDLECYHHQFH